MIFLIFIILVQTIYNPFSWKPFETHLDDEETDTQRM